MGSANRRQSTRPESRWATRTAAVLGLLLCTRCSALLEAKDSQCSTDADCTAAGFLDTKCSDGACVPLGSTGGAGGAGGTSGSGGTGGEIDAGGPWGCVGNVVWPEPDPSVPASASIRVVKLIGQTPFPGLKVKICPSLDIACETPLNEVTSDETGLLTIPVYKGFQGHMLASPPASFPEMFPLVLYLLPPPQEEETELRNGTINVTSNAEMTTITSVAGKTIEPGTGHLFITANDCLGQRAAGVSFKTDIVSPTTGTFYVGDNGLPSQTLASTANRGEGAIINVPTGFVTLTAVSDEAGKIAQFTVVVVADHIIGVPVVPSPL